MLFLLRAILSFSSSCRGWRLGGLVGLVGLAGGLVWLGLSSRGPTEDDSARRGEGSVQRLAGAPHIHFTDITRQAGLTFHHVNGAFGKRLLPETMGSGVAFIDYDRDGLPDILLVNSCYWPGYESAGAPRPTLALYRNCGQGRFVDVTHQVGLAVTFYGMGVTVGDYDNDGWDDLFITAVGGNHLFHNVPDGKGGRRFEDVTAQAGDLARSSGWLSSGDFLDRETPIDFPSSAAFVDYDNDGLLDLFVCNYVVWSPKIDLVQNRPLEGVGRVYGPPRAFEGTFCQLFRNLGNGKFQDVSAQAGIQVRGPDGRPAAKALGIAVRDVDGDGWPDLIVANDTVRNFFFHNQRNGTFREMGQEAGVAYAEGQARGAMGVDQGELRPGITVFAIANFTEEPTSLLRLDDPRRLLFSDVAAAEGLAGPSRNTLRFGLFFFDFDLDGREDLLTCNGHLEPAIQRLQPEQSYRQPVQLFWNTGRRPGFALLGPEECGPDLFQPLVGRGCAFADIDGNGTLDVLLTENGGPARLFRNEGGSGHNWVRLLLRGDGRRCNTNAIGARVTLVAGGHVQRREVTSARGYLSQSEFPLTFGLGQATHIDRVEILWPGQTDHPQVLTNLQINRLHVIHQRRS